MSMKTLQLLGVAARVDDDALDCTEDRRRAKRSAKTPSDKLEAAAQAVYNDLRGQLAGSRSFSPHGDHSPELQFEVPFVEIVPDDVVAAVSKRFTEIGFQAEHHYCDGLNHYDFLEITAPPNWVELLLKAFALWTLSSNPQTVPLQACNGLTPAELTAALKLELCNMWLFILGEFEAVPHIFEMELNTNPKFGVIEG